VYNKTGFDRTLYDRDSGDGATIYADLAGGLTLGGFIRVRAATTGDLPVGIAVVGAVGLRVPLSADIILDVYPEPAILKAHTQLGRTNIALASELAVNGGLRIPVSADVAAGVAFEGDILKSRVPLAPNPVTIGGTVDALTVALRFPIPESDLAIGADIGGYAILAVPIAPTDFTLSGELKSAPIFEPDSAKLELIGIDLAPGGELIIDTDALEVLLNGTENVDAVSGDSDFFRLVPGSNRVVVMDGETARELDVTFVWSNRFL
jgi:hypothetical protein